MSKLAIRLLGPFRAELDGQPVIDFRSDKTRALLAYLSLESHYPWTRAHLADLFWPDYPEKKAQSNLRNALWNLRHVLGETQGNPQFIFAEKSTIQFNPHANYWIDVQNFFSQVDEICAGGSHPLDFEEIAAFEPILFHKEANFLEGLHIDNPVFDTWVVKYRYLIHQKRMEAIRAITRAAFDSGVFTTALDYARKWIEFEPWEEAAYQQSMMILAALDRRNAAINQYKLCAERLLSDLGVEPQPETVQLFKEISHRAKVDGSPEKINLHQEFIRHGIDAGPLPQFLLESLACKWRERAFFGRQKELSILDEWLKLALRGQGRVGFVSGEPGSGKSFLLAEYVKRSLERYPDLLILQGQCIAYSGRGDPYLPFIHIARTLAGEFTQLTYTLSHKNQLERLWKYLPLMICHLLEYGSGLIQSFLTGRDVSDFLEIHPGIKKDCVHHLQSLKVMRKGRVGKLPINDQFTQVIGHLSEKIPVLLILDDLHWIDEGSASLLFHLGRQIAGKRVLILGAFRPEEIRFGCKTDAHPMENIIREFQSIYDNMIVDLFESEGQAFIDELLSSEVNRFSAEFRQNILRHTTGHPLFTIELLRGMQLRNEIKRDKQGNWIESDHLDWILLPSRIEAVIARRFNLLPEICKPLLAPACVQGDTFYVEVIASILGRPVEEIFELVNEYGTNQHQLIMPHSPLQVGEKWLTCFEFRHALFQVYLYNQLSDVEKHRLHGQIGEVLENLFTEWLDQYPEMLQKLAQHFEKAGQVEKAVIYYTKAGKHAVGLSACQEGIRFYYRALALLKQMTPSERRDQLELDIQLNLGPPLTILKGWGAPEMDQAYSRAQVLCENISDAETVIPFLWHLKGFRLGRAEHEKAEHLANRLNRIGRKVDDSALAAIANMQVTSFYQGKFKEAKVILERAAIPKDIYLQRCLAQKFGMAPAGVALCHLHNCLWVMGYSERAAQADLQGTEIAKAVEHPLTDCYVACRACWVGAVKHDIPLIQARIDPLIETARDCEFKIIECAALFFRNLVSVQLGLDMVNALDKMEAVMNEYHATGTILNRPAFLGLFAQNCLDVKQNFRGLRAIDESIRLAQNTGELWFQAEAWRIKGDLLLAMGEGSHDQSVLSQVDSCYRSAYQIAHQQNAKAFELRAALSMMQLGLLKRNIRKTKRILLRTLDWFTEGLDSPDIVEARNLLERRA